MRTFRARIAPLSPFGTRPLGDTLFGQLCWTVRNRHSEGRLVGLLDGYTMGQPFAVLSDAFPADHLPRPSLPGHWYSEVTGEDRKSVKRRTWLPVSKFDQPVETWLKHCLSPADLPGAALSEHAQPHNTINRTTGTTGDGQFSPYSVNQLWYGRRQEERRAAWPSVRLDVYVALDDTRLSADELRSLLMDMGQFGFGRDASIGLGKYRLDDWTPVDLPVQSGSNAWLTLGPCAPQDIGWDPALSFYQTFTRFGRHGDLAVHLGNPFKTPLLLAMTGAVLAPRSYRQAFFIGRGLGGDGSLSRSVRGTVHQGYAPVLGIRFPLGNRRETTAS